MKICNLNAQGITKTLVLKEIIPALSMGYSASFPSERAAAFGQNSDTSFSLSKS